MGNEASTDGKKKGKKGEAKAVPQGKYANLGGTKVNVLDESDFLEIKDLDKEYKKKEDTPNVGSLLDLNFPTTPQTAKPNSQPQLKQQQPPPHAQLQPQHPNSQPKLQPLQSQPPLQQPIKNPATSQQPLKMGGGGAVVPQPQPQPQLQPLQPQPLTPQQPIKPQSTVTNPPITTQPLQPQSLQPTAVITPQPTTQPPPTTTPTPNINNNSNNKSGGASSVNNSNSNNNNVGSKDNNNNKGGQSNASSSSSASSAVGGKLIEFTKSFAPQSDTPYCELSPSPCHLNITEAMTITAYLSIEVEIPKNPGNVTQWIIYTPIPPLTCFQTHTQVSFQISSHITLESFIQSQVIKDHQAVGGDREIVQIQIDCSKFPSSFFGRKLPLKFLYKACVYARELFYDPNMQLPYQIATDSEIYNSTSPTLHYSYTDEYFYSFFQENSLLWRLESEIGVDSIFYVHRVYQYVSQNFQFDETNNPPHLRQSLQQILSTRKGNSAELSLVFCSILRCQSIPARSISGRWVVEEKLLSKPLSPQRSHTVTEFYVDHVGWIPADVSRMILFGANMPWSSQGTMPFFGTINSHFLGLHIDFDFEFDVGSAGKTSSSSLTTPLFFDNLKNPLNVSSSSWHLSSREVLN